MTGAGVRAREPGRVGGRGPGPGQIAGLRICGSEEC